MVQVYPSLGYTMVARQCGSKLSFSCLIVIAVVAVEDAILLPTFLIRITEGTVMITCAVIVVAAAWIEKNDHDDADDDTDDDSNR